MKSRPLRGLPALCLLCVLPRLGALTLNFTDTQGRSGTGTQVPLGVNSTWVLPAFDPANGVPSEIYLSFRVQSHITAAEWNALQEPMTVTMTAGLGSRLTASVGNGTEFFTATPLFLPVVSQSEPTVVLAPQGIATIDANLSQIIFGRFTGSNVLPFLDPAGVRLTFFAGAFATPTRFGGGNHTAQFDASITYVVPDEGSIGWLVALSSAALIVFRRLIALA